VPEGSASKARKRKKTPIEIGREEIDTFSLQIIALYK